jgi:hypothetical protein
VRAEFNMKNDEHSNASGAEAWNPEEANGARTDRPGAIAGGAGPAGTGTGAGPGGVQEPQVPSQEQGVPDGDESGDRDESSTEQRRASKKLQSQVVNQGRDRRVLPLF